MLIVAFSIWLPLGDETLAEFLAGPKNWDRSAWLNPPRNEALGLYETTHHFERRRL
jgi:hypothetical protein